MEKTKSKKSSTYSVLAKILIAVAILGASARIRSWACSGGDECGDLACSTVFNPEIIAEPKMAPFFLSDHAFYKVDGDMRENSAKSLTDLNTSEWQSFLQKSVKRESVVSLVYKSSTADIDALIFALRDKKAPSTPLAKNLYPELAKVPDATTLKQALFYLGFAKRIEPVATRAFASNSWGSKEEGDEPAPATSKPAFPEADKMVLAADKFVQNTTNRFLTARYRFQVLRIYFYSKRFDETIQYYDAHSADFVGSQSIEYRALETVAGSLFNNKSYARANYLYSLIFEHFEALKPDASLSFHPQEESDWNETLKLAKTQPEKSVLWFLLGLKSDGPRAIEKILEIDPQSDFLNTLVVREVNKAEQTVGIDKLIPKEGSDAAPVRELNPATLTALGHGIDSGKVAKPYVWSLALAHLSVLARDETRFQKFLAQSKKLVSSNEAEKTQLRMTELFGRIKFLKAPPEGDSAYLASELSWLKASKDEQMQTLLGWSQGMLSQLYSKKGDSIRRLAWVDNPSSDVYQDNKKVDEMISFLTKVPSGAQAPLDLFVRLVYPYSVASLKKIQAILLTAEDKLPEALALYKQEISIGKDTLLANPFRAGVNDCHDCDFEAKDKESYTRLSFLQKMVNLQKEAAGTGEGAATASFQLGNAFYNLSYFGNSRAYGETAQKNFQNFYFPPGLGEKYYSQALSQSTNPELKAQATFMLAKVDHNKTYKTMLEQYQSLDSEDFPAGPFFKSLKDNFSKTKYYQEVLKECGYFKTYIDQNSEGASKPAPKKGKKS